jgi:hypothetical protein
MAQPPRKSSPSRPFHETPPPEDLFAGEAAASAAEEWTLDEPASKLPPRPRAGALPASPILPVQTGGFESNPNVQDKIDPSPEITGAVPLPAAPAPPVAPHIGFHDPFEIDDELPVVAPVVRVTPPKPESRPEAEFEGNSRPDLTESPETPEPAPARPDRFGLATAAALLTTLLVVFGTILYLNRPTSEAATSRTLPDLPITGNIVTLTDIKSGWRSRQPADRVSSVDVTLPTPSRQQPALLPVVQFTCDPASGKTGFLRFIFFDPDGKISGDVRVVKLSNGSIDPLSSGAIVAGPGGALVYGSLGFMDRPGFVAYASSSSSRWSVEVRESSDYNAKEAGWTLLQTFDILNGVDP